MKDKDKGDSYWDVAGLGPYHPMYFVNWHDAGKFIEALMRHDPRHAAMLPSEAHWEHACRAGTDTEYYTGDGDAALRLAGWFNSKAAPGTRRVGRLEPNAWGLYDMHGNVWEWCADAWDRHAYARRPDGWIAVPWTTTEDNPVRVLRGGSWLGTAWDCRSSCRGRWRPRNRYRSLGFRLLLACGPVEQERSDQPPPESGAGDRSRRARDAPADAGSRRSGPPAGDTLR